jgi:hypothetical protein
VRHAGGDDGRVGAARGERRGGDASYRNDRLPFPLLAHLLGGGEPTRVGGVHGLGNVAV